jgi:CheY-like chemotaxis protein
LRLLERAWETQRGFDVLLIDWKMPEMDGLEVVRKTHSMLQEKGIPQMPVIVMVTAHSRERLRIEGSDLNLDVILTKPVLVSGLFDTFVRLQRGKVYHGQTAATPLPQKIPANIRGARILVVEDNPINQQVAREFLEREGFEVFMANDGRECLAAVRQSAFDLVLMDLHMPEMDGFEATRALRQEARYAQLPIVAMTAAAMEKDRTACLTAGMNDHLAKPIDHHDLTRVLIKWIKPRSG